MPPRTWPVQFSRAAQEHIAEQAEWYAREKSGEDPRLPERFRDAVQAAAESLTVFPRRNRLIDPVGARAIKARPFQFALWYDTVGTTVVVFAVLHQHMDPTNAIRIVAQAHRYAAASMPLVIPPSTAA